MLRSSDINKPRQRVSTYHILSAQPRIVPQEKGSMKRARIWGDTVFVDYETRWVKVHLMQYKSGDYTLEVREYFERDCITRNDVTKNYHADNGRSAENTSKQDCEENATS